MVEFNTAEKLNDKLENPIIEVLQSDVTTGNRDKKMYLYYQLIKSMRQASRIDIIVSFLMESGVKMLLKELERALNRGAKVRILTGNCLGLFDC